MTAYERDFELSCKIMLIAIILLFAAALLILFLHLYLQWRYLRRISALRRSRSRLVFAGEIQNGPSPADRGLVPDILKSLPIFVFSNADTGDGEEVVECAVCLNEFEEGEKVRSLPRCGHRFHIECIDMWFYSHANCPLCRAAAAAAPPPQVNITVPERIPMSYPSAASVAEQDGSPRNLCFRYRGGEGIGSSSANIVIREGFTVSEEEQGLGSPMGQSIEASGSPILLLKRFLGRDTRLHRSGSLEAEPDLERGEGAELSPPPPYTPLPPPAAAV